MTSEYLNLKTELLVEPAVVPIPRAPKLRPRPVPLVIIPFLALPASLARESLDECVKPPLVSTKSKETCMCTN